MHFRLVRYFTLTSLLFFVVAGAGLGYFYRAISLENMLRLQEASNVNLTRVFANNLWTSHFVPLLAETHAGSASEAEKNSRIKEIHDKVLALMRDSTTYKIKVYDLKGRTVYSSELKQIGEDKSTNAGFLGALAGEARTELVHKEKFSAFEQIVENRDLIQSYIPRHDPQTRQIVGVFEIYSDVTPFLSQIRHTEQLLAGVVTLAFGTLFMVLFIIVRHAGRVITRQEKERQLSQQQLAQSEKMASLGQLVAGVAHQLNTPLAFSHNNVSLAIEAVKSFALPLRVPEKDADTVVQMLGDVLQGVGQMKELVDNLRDFTRLNRAKVVDADLNASLRTVVYVAKSAIPTRIGIVEEYGDLPPLECNPSQLNQVFLNLISNAAQAIAGAGQITVRSALERNHIRVDVIDTGSGIPPEALPHIFDSYFTTKAKGEGTGLGLPIARDIVRSHGGDISIASVPGAGTTFTVILPLEPRRDMSTQAH